MRRLTWLVYLAVPVAMGMLIFASVQPNGVSAQARSSFDKSAPRAEFPKTDFSKASVEASEILSGGPPRDGIPAIDKPQFQTITDAAEWLGLNEPVVSLRVGDTAKAYPLQIMIYHEIVNDRIEDQPVVVTFCPLCNASIVFDASVNGRTLDFGTTGRLRKSD